VLTALLTESTLSQIEMLRLVSTFNSITDNRFNCSVCIKSTSAAHREEKKRCNTPGEKPVAKYHDYLNYYRCPGAFRSQDSVELILAHRLWEQGVLPYDGGLLDQPAKYVEAMRLIDGLKIEHQKDLEFKAEKWRTTRSQSNSRSNRRRR
jgi:hypothetical protein